MKASEEAVDRIFRALSDRTRREIVRMVSARSVSVSQLAEPLGISVPAVLQHLQILEECGLVKTEKVGRTRSCRIVPAGLSVAEQWMHACRSLWETRLDRLSDLLTEPDED